MDKSLRVILIIIVLLAVGNLVFSFFQKSQIKEIQNDIKLSQKNIDLSLKDIKAAQIRIDSIQKNLSAYINYVKNDKILVDSMNLQKLIGEAKSNNQIAGMRKDLSNHLEKITKEDKEISSLPEIQP